MPLNYRELSANLRNFYDFRGKIVLYVGAGGRQLLDRSSGAKKLMAIDKNLESIKQLRTNASAGQGLPEEVVLCGFENVSLEADVVYFEFCLHEMNAPGKALRHARSLAPNTVVFDHVPGSQWAYHAAEEHKVMASNEAMERFGIQRRQRFLAHQFFRDHAELLAKVSSQGPIAVRRTRRFACASDFSISMDYQLVLL